MFEGTPFRTTPPADYHHAVEEAASETGHSIHPFVGRCQRQRIASTMLSLVDFGYGLARGT
eukprot:10224902-Alexandrium_andersonii.AAC.1